MSKKRGRFAHSGFTSCFIRTEGEKWKDCKEGFYFSSCRPCFLFLDGVGLNLVSSCFPACLCFASFFFLPLDVFFSRFVFCSVISAVGWKSFRVVRPSLSSHMCVPINKVSAAEYFAPTLRLSPAECGRGDFFLNFFWCLSSFSFLFWTLSELLPSG